MILNGLLGNIHISLTTRDFPLSAGRRCFHWMSQIYVDNTWRVAANLQGAFLCGLGARPGIFDWPLGSSLKNFWQRCTSPRRFAPWPVRFVSLRRITVTWKWTRWKVWLNTQGTCTHTGFYKSRPISTPLSPQRRSRWWSPTPTRSEEHWCTKPEGWKVALATLRGGFHQFLVSFVWGFALYLGLCLFILHILQYACMHA